MTLARILTRIWITLVDESLTVLAGVASIAHTNDLTAFHVTVAVLAWIHATIKDRIATIEARETDGTFAFVAVDQINTCAIVQAFHIVQSTVVYVCLASIACEAWLTQTEAAKTSNILVIY